jgi:probable O-glycosylation ligase (exosortase A-associated)
VSRPYSAGPDFGATLAQSRGDENSGGQVGIAILLFAYVVIEFVRPQFFFPAIGYIRPGLVLSVLLLTISLFHLRSDAYSDTAIRAMIGFSVFSVASIFYATNTYWAFHESRSVVAHVFAFAIPFLLYVRNEERFRKFIHFWICINAYLALFGLAHGGRGPGSFLSDENDLALALNVGLPFAYFLQSVDGLSSRGKLFYRLASVLLVIGIVATSSRGGFVALCASVLAIIYFSRNKFRNFVVVLLAATVFFFMIPEEYKSEISSISDTREATAAGRLYQWRMGWDMYVDNPVFGVGAGNYPWRVAYYELQSKGRSPSGRLHGGRAAHSLYFTLLPELGTLGLALFVVALTSAIKRLRRIARDEAKRNLGRGTSLAEASARATIVAFIAYLSAGMFVSVLYYPHFWYLVAIAVALDAIMKQDSTLAVSAKTSNRLLNQKSTLGMQ